MWLFVTKYDFKVLLMQFCQDDSPWRIGGLFLSTRPLEYTKKQKKLSSKSNPSPQQTGTRRIARFFYFVFCIRRSFDFGLEPLARHFPGAAIQGQNLPPRPVAKAPGLRLRHPRRYGGTHLRHPLHGAAIGRAKNNKVQV